MAGWVPRSDKGKLKFTTWVLCPEGSRAWVDCGQDGRREKGGGEEEREEEEKGVGVLAGKAGGGGG